MPGQFNELIHDAFLPDIFQFTVDQSSYRPLLFTVWANDSVDNYATNWYHLIIPSTSCSHKLFLSMSVLSKNATRFIWGSIQHAWRRCDELRCELFERHAALPGDAVAERNDAILIKQMAIGRSAPADVVVCGAWCGGWGWEELSCVYLVSIANC